MKWYGLLILALTLGFGQVEAAIISLDVSDPNVTVGETFDVDVLIDGEDIGEELLAFGFDVLPTGGLLSYVGATVAAQFTDVSDPFNAANVSGAAFPGVAQDDVLLATLTFSADAAGSDVISISGLFDGMFMGLFYELSGFDIAAAVDVLIAESGPVGVPEPSELALILIGLAGLACMRTMLGHGGH